MIERSGLYSVVGLRVAAALAIFLAAMSMGGFAATRTIANNNEGSYKCGFPYSGSGLVAIPWQNDSTHAPTGIYITAFDNAQESWSIGPHVAYFSYSSTADHKRSARPEGSATRRGHIDRDCSWTRTKTRWWVNIDHPQLVGDVPVPHFWKQSAAAHESGHHIWASHSTHSTNAIMKQGRNDANNGPILDDNCAIQQRYPSTAWPLQCSYSGGP